MAGAELNDQPAGDDHCQADPSSQGDCFLEDKLAEKNANQRKDRDIDTEQFREIPFHGVYDDTVSTEDHEAGDNEDDAISPQSFANERVASDFQ